MCKIAPFCNWSALPVLAQKTEICSNCKLEQCGASGWSAEGAVGLSDPIRCQGNPSSKLQSLWVLVVPRSWLTTWRATGAVDPIHSLRLTRWNKSQVFFSNILCGTGECQGSVIKKFDLWAGNTLFRSHLTYELSGKLLLLTGNSVFLLLEQTWVSLSTPF